MFEIIVVSSPKFSELPSNVLVHHVAGQNCGLSTCFLIVQGHLILNYASLSTPNLRIGFCQSWDHLWFFVLLSSINLTTVSHIEQDYDATAHISEP